MASSRSSRGRVFCVTGMHNPSQQQELSVTPNVIGTGCVSTNVNGQSDSDSNTSGYLSSSSFESSGEDKRLVLNEQKVFNVWTKWGEQVRVPKSSTPKQGSEYIAYKKLAKRVNMSSDSGRCMLALKKNLYQQSKKTSTNNENETADSFWDIKTPKVHRSSSEGDVNKSDKHNDAMWKRQSVQTPIKHDAGQEIVTCKILAAKKSQDWKRRPFLTLSDSQLDLRLSGVSDKNHSAKNRTKTYNALPRYRVKVDEDPVVSKTYLAQQITKSCADFSDTGVPVDESMSEFLSKVDRENLASFLNFYDRMTNTSAYEKARRNPNNYEAVFY